MTEFIAGWIIGGLMGAFTIFVMRSAKHDQECCYYKNRLKKYEKGAVR